MGKERQAIIEMMRESVDAFEGKFYRKPAYIELSQAEFDALGVGPEDGPSCKGVPIFVGADGCSTREGFGLRSDDLYTFEALPAADARFVRAEVDGKADSSP